MLVSTALLYTKYIGDNNPPSRQAEISVQGRTICGHPDGFL